MTVRREAPLRAAVIGCRMGARHAQVLARLAAYELVAVCDLNVEAARQAAAAANGVQVYTDYAAMLAEVRPDVVAIATPNNLHAAQTLQAVQAGARGICCEKPLAVNLADGRRMVEACREAGVPLIVNHQRRLGADLAEARRLIAAGVLGELVVLRGSCAGDMLSDGTHLLDSLLWLAGDEPVEWVLGQVHREPGAADGDASGASGFRYGHPVESGALAVVRLRSGLRLELATGDLRPASRLYQDYEVVGSRGALWRAGDDVGRNLFLHDAQGGGWVTGRDGWAQRPVPALAGEGGEWRPVSLARRPVEAMSAAYALLAATIAVGTPHPMAGDYALRGLEVLLAIYESARLHRRVRLPLAQDRFPLELMLEAGAL